MVQTKKKTEDKCESRLHVRCGNQQLVLTAERMIDIADSAAAQLM